MKNCLLIDCYDSFTYKLAQTLEEGAGFNVTIRKYDKINHLYLCGFDSVVLSPGPGLPHEYPEIFRFLQFLKNKPVFGVCLGHQIIGKYCGADLYHTGNVYHGQKVNIKVLEKAEIYKNMESKFNVGLYHSWAVRNIPFQLETTAVSENGIVMSLKHKKHPWHSVQFHPESYITGQGREIFKNWYDLIN